MLFRSEKLNADGLAAKAGLQAGYTLVSVQVGDREVVEISRGHHIIDEMLWARAGDEITVVCLDTEGETVTVTVTMTQDILQKY